MQLSVDFLERVRNRVLMTLFQLRYVVGAAQFFSGEQILGESETKLDEAQLWYLNRISKKHQFPMMAARL